MLCCLLVTTTAAATACSGPVEIESPELDAAGRAACSAMLDDLPAELADEDQREIEPDDAFGAAYGDPAIVIVCVDSAPEGFTDLSPCEQVNDVGWYVPADEAGDPEAVAVVTAMTHRPLVQVTIPADYRPDGAAAALAELSDPIADNLELVDECL